MGVKSSKVNRALYFWIILIISVVALIGNLLAIRTVFLSKYKYLQKTCVISLAVSDLMTVILFSMNNLFLLKHKPMIWIYGEFLCHFIPIGQIWGNLTSSISLLVIALDRYHNVIHALSPKWNPSLIKCLCGAGVAWLICLGLSYPVVTFYIYIPILVNNHETAMCSGAPITKHMIFVYYITMNCLFFLPIVLLFFWFYYKIAFLIWRHRKPLNENYNHQEVTETSYSSKPVQDTSSTSVPRAHTKQKNNPQMQQKIRSFKIVVALIVAFIGCRMPYWLLMLFQQVGHADRNLLWNIRFAVIALYMFNCALNPLLYTYLSITIMACRKLSRFVSEICCCCFFNSEFEEFERRSAEDIVGVENKKMENEKEKNNKIKVQFIDSNVNKYNEREIY